MDKTKFDEHMVKWFVYFIGRNGVKRCHCFENDEQQARHFASLVNGRVELEIDGHTVYVSKEGGNDSD